MCDHRLFLGPLVCTQTGPHATHTYEASDAPDRHDETAGDE